MSAYAKILLVLLLLAVPAVGDEHLQVDVSAEVTSGLYGETGRLTIRLTFRTRKPIPERYQVVLHLAEPGTGVAFATADHVPPLSTEQWKVGEPVRYTVQAVVPEVEGVRPEVLVLVGLADPTLDNGYRGRLKLGGEEPYLDRRYVVARVEKASSEATSAELRRVAAERAQRGETGAAFHLLVQALSRATTLAEKLGVTADLLRLDPPPGDAVSGPEETFIRRLVAAEKLRWLRDRAGALLKRKELKLALRVMEKVGGVAEEERNTKVVGEPNETKRAEKDIIDVKSRMLRDLPEAEVKELARLLDKAEGDPKKIIAAARAQKKKGRNVLARRLLLEVRYHRSADNKQKEEAEKLIKEIEHELLHALTPAQEKRLESVSDHPAFHRLEKVPTGRFIFLGPGGLVQSIPRASSHRFDVASVLLDDLFGRSPVKPGQRVVVYYKETYSGPATGGGRQIVIGDADPKAQGTKVDTGLYYHEYTHCVDDTRPVHNYKRGLSEGLANLGALFVNDMFAGEKGRFEALARAGREAFRRHHLDRKNAYWLIPAYAPSEGMMTEILARHAPAENGHVDWTTLAAALRAYRASMIKNPRTHRIMAHFGKALADAMGEGVWDTLAEFRFPVTRETGEEVGSQAGGGEARLRSLAMRRDVRGLQKLADESDPEFLSCRARYAALQILDARSKGESEEAEAIRTRLGVIREFHVIGPFYPSAGAGLAEMCPPEEDLDLTKEYMTPQGVARWMVPERSAQHYALLDGRGIVRLNYGYPDRAVTYALAHVIVPEATDAVAWLGADDEIALFVNDKIVQRNHGRRPLVPDWERWPCRLRAGRNRVVVKLANEHGQTGFCLRFALPDGSAIPGLATDLEPAEPIDAPAEPKWKSVLKDNFQRRSLGRKYEVAAGKFELKGKALRGVADGRRPGWRPFSVRPGFPQDRPAALLWLKDPANEIPADFRWRIGLAKASVPKLTLTWDGEGDELPLSGWSLILVPKKGRFTARLERYDYLHYVKGLEQPKEWKEAVVEVLRVGGRLTVRVGGMTVFDAVSTPPLARRRFGLAVWGREPAIDSMELALPRR